MARGPNNSNTKGGFRRHRRWLIWTVVSLLALVAVVFAALPYAAELALTHWLRTHGADHVAMSSLSVDPFRRRIRIRELSVQRAEAPAVRIADTRLHFAWAPLLAGRVELHRLAMQGLRGTVAAHTDGAWRAGSWTVFRQAARASAVSWRIDRWLISASSVTVRGPHRTLTFQIRQAELGAFGASGPDPAAGPIPVHVDMALDPARLTLDGHLSSTPQAWTLEAEVALDDLQLQQITPPPADLDRFDATTAVAGELEARYRPGERLRAAVTGALTVRELSARRDAQGLFQQRARWDGELRTTVTADGVTRVTGRGQLQATGLEWRGSDGGWTLQLAEWTWDGNLDLRRPTGTEGPRLQGTTQARGLELDRPSTDLRLLALADLRLDGVELTKDRLTVEGARARGLRLGQALAPPSPDTPWHGEPLLNLARLRLGPLSLAQGRTVVDSIRVEDATGLLRRGPDRQWHLWPRVGRALAALAPPDLRIGRSEVTGNSGLRLVDHGVEPAYRTTLRLHGARLEALDTRAPDQPTRLALGARVGDYGRLSVSGSLRPFAEPAGADLGLRVRDLALPDLRGYARQHLALDVADGYLNGAAEVQTQGRALALLAQLDIKRLVVEPVPGAAPVALTEPLSLSLPTTLSLLRDPADHIRLEVPLRFHPDEALDPSTTIARGLGRALDRTARAYLEEQLAPHGDLIRPEESGDDAAPRLSEVPFAPDQAELGDRAVAYLDRIATLLAQRPQLAITLCATTRAAERASPRGPASSGAELQRRRQRAIRQYLVETKGVTPGQLSFCQPSARTGG